MADGVDRRGSEGKKVLVVEDETLISMLFEDILGELGCEVVGPALNIRQATGTGQRAEIDAAVLDVNLNGEPIFPVAEILRGARACRWSSRAATGRRASADWQDAPTLPKPFTSDEVGVALSALTCAVTRSRIVAPDRARPACAQRGRAARPVRRRR